MSFLKEDEIVIQDITQSIDIDDISRIDPVNIVLNKLIKDILEIIIPEKYQQIYSFRDDFFDEKVREQIINDIEEEAKNINKLKNELVEYKNKLDLQAKLQEIKMNQQKYIEKYEKEGNNTKVEIEKL